LIDPAGMNEFGAFLRKFAEKKPETAEKLTCKASSELCQFVTEILDGLAKSNRGDVYSRVMKSEVGSIRNLAQVARHCRHSKLATPELASQLLDLAIESSNTIAVKECLLYAIKQFDSDRIDEPDAYIARALEHLNSRKEPSWTSEASYLRDATAFYENLTLARAKQVLHSIGFLNRLSPRIEDLLSRIAERHLEAVWDFLESRLFADASGRNSGEEYRAVPFRLYSLHEVLSNDPKLAISYGLKWFTEDATLFQFRGGHLLSAIFPDCPANFAAELVATVKKGDRLEANFVLAVLQNYNGDAPHDILKEIVARHHDDPKIMSLVGSTIDNTGVVAGDFGFAKAWRTKRDSLTDWFSDMRPEVVSFAKAHIAKLDRAIAQEQRRAETDRELRLMDFDEPDTEPESGVSDQDNPVE
jgi:hypothetical protein